MINVIIIIVLLIVIASGIRETVNHFKGEGACCGNSSAKIKRKKLKNRVLHVYTFRVKDMHCRNCVNAVMGAINDIEGATARVSLNKKSATVLCDRDIDAETIEAAILKRGYDAELISGSNT